jgi:hypothetical protein
LGLLDGQVRKVSLSFSLLRKNGAGEEMASEGERKKKGGSGHWIRARMKWSKSSASSHPLLIRHSREAQPARYGMRDGGPPRPWRGREKWGNAPTSRVNLNGKNPCQ